MAGSYRPVRRDQQFLLPVDMSEWLPDDHLAWFLIDLVAELDTSAFHADRVLGGRGRAAYDPDMLLALLLCLREQGAVVAAHPNRRVDPGPG